MRASSGVVGLARHREDRQFLRLHQGVEDIDHRDAGAHHVPGMIRLAGLTDGPPMVVRFSVSLCAGPAIARLAAAGEDAAQQRRAKTAPASVAEETNLGVGARCRGCPRTPAGTRVSLQADDLGERSALGEVTWASSR
jgi:hypothetical protein